MNWSPEKIRELRLRLGWDLCQFSRRLGVDTEIVRSWEQGEERPYKECLREMNQLHMYAEQNSEHTACQPLADTLMQEYSLDQITISEVVNSSLDNDPT
ncbi:MAG: hypothetical protein H6626_14705 [Pseudobdellovibrionaceae bacterium]|nr:hypothetical protein [Bdellovibrionales bacterium]USN47414.1 MAG: hypothetical protein H6626_14705 [Pseudobdellovibrionaceae bacterium]